MPSPPLRLRGLVLEALKKHDSVLHLAQEIQDANELARTGCSISRKMLSRIKHGEDVAYTHSNLVALHTYFKRFGYSLQHLPVLEQRGVFEAFSNQRPLVFMIGAKPRPREERTDVSQWDLLAHATLAWQASQHGLQPVSHIQHVTWRNPDSPAALGGDPWYSMFDEEKSAVKDRPSVISMGSSLAALSSEVMKALMFGFVPFQRPKVEHRPPFAFVWVHRLSANFHSAFGLTYRELRLIDPAVAERVRRNRSTAFVLGDEVYESPVRNSEWTMYGVIAAQRRAAGNVWLVVAGLHGPATYGAATKVSEIDDELPWALNPHQPGAVLWVPVEVRVRGRTPKPYEGDVREVVDAELIGKPHIWPEGK